MDENQFLRGIEGEKQQGEDLVAGAEHLVRLKIQSGQQTEPQHPDLELTKEARIFGEHTPHTIDHASIPHSQRLKHYKSYVDSKAGEEPTGYGKAMLGGGLVGGGIGALFGGLAHGGHGAGGGALMGGGLGAGIGALLAAGDKSNIRGAQKIQKDRSYSDSMAKDIAHRADAKEFNDYMTAERRHRELMSKEAGFIDGVKAPFREISKSLKDASTVQRAKKFVERNGAPRAGRALSKERNKHVRKALGTVATMAVPAAIGYKAGKNKQADLSESIGTAAMCKDCGKVKEACGCGPRMKTASFNKAKEALKHLMRTNPTARAAILGGTVGAVGSGALGAMSAPPGHRMSSALDSGIKGGIVGAGTGALYQHLHSKVAYSPDWNKKMLMYTTGAGALAGGVGTYLSSRPQEDTGKSKMEEDLEGAVAAHKAKPERGFLEKLKNRETESAHGIAKAFREHPVKASLLGLLTGGATGYGIGQIGGAIARHRGGK